MQIATALTLYHMKGHSEVGEWLIWQKNAIFNTFRDNTHLLILVAITQLCKWFMSFLKVESLLTHVDSILTQGLEKKKNRKTSSIHLSKLCKYDL